MKKIIIVALFALAGTSAQAQTVTNPGGNIGILGGVSSLNNSGGTSFTYGAAVTGYLGPVWQLGAQFNSVSPSNTIYNGVSYSNSITNIDASIKWVPGGSVDGLKLGILLGATIYSTGLPNSSSTTNMNYGVTGLYDFLIGDRWSVGPQIDILWNTNSASYSVTNILASIRYWF